MTTDNHNVQVCLVPLSHHITSLKLHKIKRWANDSAVLILTPELSFADTLIVLASNFITRFPPQCLTSS